jgi:hypothetical protein
MEFCIRASKYFLEELRYFKQTKKNENCIQHLYGILTGRLLEGVKRAINMAGTICLSQPI